MDLIELDMPFNTSSLEKLKVLDFNNFSNGLLILSIQSMEYFPIIYRLKKTSAEDVINILNKLNVKQPITFIKGYTSISNDIIYFSLM